MRVALALAVVTWVAAGVVSLRAQGPVAPPGSTADVFARLAPSCEGCHGPRASKPFFASAAAFEELLAGNPRYVTRGRPEESELVKLLEARGSGAYPQMPPVGPTFAKIAGTAITVADVRAWIASGAVRATAASPSTPALARRLTAEHILTALYAQLGLEDGDFFDAAFSTARRDTYAARSPDAAPAQLMNSNIGTAFARFRDLGGPEFLAGRPRQNGVSRSFVQLFVPLSQAYCRLAVEKPNNTAIFRHASPSDTSTTSDGRRRIQQNLSYLYRRMLALTPSEAELASLLDGVFVKYEATGPADAWTATCASLVQHPLWLTY